MIVFIVEIPRKHIHIPLYGIEVIDQAHDGETIETPTNNERGDSCTYDSKHYNGTKVLEEVALQVEREKERERERERLHDIELV